MEADHGILSLLKVGSPHWAGGGGGEAGDQALDPVLCLCPLPCSLFLPTQPSLTHPLSSVLPPSPSASHKSLPVPPHSPPLLPGEQVCLSPPTLAVLLVIMVTMVTTGLPSPSPFVLMAQHKRVRVLTPPSSTPKQALSSILDKITQKFT